MHAIDMKLLSMRVQYPASTCILFSGWRVMGLDNVWVFQETNLLSVWNWSIFVNFWSLELQPTSLLSFPIASSNVTWNSRWRFYSYCWLKILSVLQQWSYHSLSEAMKSVGSDGSQYLPFVGKVIVSYFVGETYNIITMPVILVMVVLVCLKLT